MFIKPVRSFQSDDNFDKLPVFSQFFGDKSGSLAGNHMVSNNFIRKSTIALILDIISAISVNFRFSTGFSPIKPEVDTLRV